jgi:hypothetical protein
MYFVFYLFFVICITNCYFVVPFIKPPLHNKQCRFVDNTSSLNKIRYYFKTLNNHKNNKEIRKPAILELPVELEEKWEEGEIPWDFVDTNVSLTKKYPPIHDAHNIAFLFI